VNSVSELLSMFYRAYKVLQLVPPMSHIVLVNSIFIYLDVVA
jgi:hypothetical protein